MRPAKDNRARGPSSGSRLSAFDKRIERKYFRTGIRHIAQAQRPSAILSLRRHTRLILDQFAARIQRTGTRIWRSDDETRCGEWFEVSGDDTLRVEYDLNSESTVLDVGGFMGQWTSDIFSRYCAHVYVFEPLPQFADSIARRFKRNARVQIYPFGLSDKSGVFNLYPDEDGTSTFQRSSEPVPAQFRAASEVFKECGFEHVDLMKINIEGGEYSLLEHLMDTGWIHRIANIQVQFHDIMPESRQHMIAIQDRLTMTHRITWQYPLVWENWEALGKLDHA
jgi:FkbM family methyltransferase